MSDHLLRLARIVDTALLYRDEPLANALARASADASQLVHDLEAAPASERRTITRKEWADALDRLTKVRDRNKMPGPALNRIMEHFRLTVEDA